MEVEITSKKTVMIAGYGSAGQYVTDFLLKDHRIKSLDEIHIMSRATLDEINPRLEISRVAAGISNRYIPLVYHRGDFNDIEGMSKIIQKVSPDVVVYTGRYASGLKYGAYSYPNEIGYGVWIPLSLPYIYNLMKAVKLSGVDTKVINSSFPDGVNYLLSQAGLAPYCGAGNLNHLVPRIKRAVSAIWGDNPEDYNVDLVGSHYLNTYVSKEGTSRGCPSFLEVTSEGSLKYANLIKRDSKLVEDIYALSKDNSASGHIRNQMIATDCAEIVRLLVEEDTKEMIHVPGFDGLPGGCRVVSGGGKFKICSRASRQEIIDINTEGLRLDGIVIRDRGIEFTEDSREKMKAVFGIDYPEFLPIDEAQEFADKISEVLRNYEV